MRYTFLARCCISLFTAVILLSACSAPPVGYQPTEVKPTAVTKQRIDLAAVTFSPPTAKPSATHTPAPTFTPLPSSTPAPTIAPTATAAPAKLASSSAGRSAPVDASTTINADSPGIERVEDTDPGPPFDIQVDTLSVEDGKYKVTGVVRNDGSETYEGIGVLGTFYVSGPQGDGMTFSRPPGRDAAPVPTPVKVSNPDKKVLWAHGPVQARCPCPFLEPGAQCPFSLEIYARDYVSYRLHPTGQPAAFHTWHEAASMSVGSLNVSNDGIGNVRITGQVVNKNDFVVKSATVAGQLLDTEGRVVSEGSTIVLGDIAPGASARFDLRIKYEPYARYELYVQGVRY
ncbi:MAG: hypothetical protein JW850_07560 [Thermoflexales bacterium]|nr:hypothetical protein [Thermoflexales bacterium]